MLIFDLDGTLSDPSLGIGRSLNYALAAFDYPPIAEPHMSQHIGPPLDVTFRLVAPTASEATVTAMVAKYRERYGDVGYAENVLYDGIADALAHLAAGGARMGVCTSKRVDFAERILDLFHLRGYFEFVNGGDVGVRKQDQLGDLLRAGAAGPDSVMIGDRAIDVLAARANNLRSVGVLWGHGSLDELQGAAPDLLLRSPEQLTRLV